MAINQVDNTTKKPDKDLKRICAILILFALILVAARSRTFYEPLDNDITLYAVIAQEMLQGRDLYTDTFEHKPPGVMVTNAIAQAIVGYNEGSIFLINILAAIATMLGIFYGAKAIAGNRGGLWAAALWVILSGDPNTQSNQPNTEVFINAFSVWGFALLVGSDRKNPKGKVLLIGLLFALASVYKQFAALLAAALAAIHVLLPAKGQTRKNAVIDLSLIGIIGAAFWALIFGYFALQGRLRDFWGTVFAFNFSYQGVARSPFIPPPGFLAVAMPLLLFVLIGFWLAGKKNIRSTALLLAFLGVAIFEAWLPGRNYPHYYQLLWPPLIIGAGIGIALLQNADFTWLRKAGMALGLLLCGALFLYQGQYYLRSPILWSQLKYGDRFIQTRLLGRIMAKTVMPGETFYVLGEDSGLYFYAKQSPPTCAISASHMMYGSERKRLRERALIDLKANPPELVTVNDDFYVSFSVSEWIKKHYVPYPGNISIHHYYFLIKKGGSMEKRLAESAQ